MRTVLLLSVALLMGASTFTPEQVRERMKKEGPGAVLNGFSESGTEWEALLAGMATGDAKWLQIGVELFPATDAGTSEALILAAGEGLEKKPDNVLKIAAPAFGLESVCSGPDVDDDRYNSKELSLKAIEHRKKMLKRVKDSALTEAAGRCRDHLDEAVPHIKRFFGG
jgi:hypothetical protein